MDLVMNLIHPTNAPDWRNQWELRRREQVSEILKKLENISELFEDMESEKEREEVMTYLRFELANHASSYILATVNDFTRSKAAVAAFAASKNAEWFIPAYEVEFNALDQFNSGSFGSVHHFLNEVKIWHKLYHPNVVQLFGACHVGNPVFVCEYAGGGQLDEYLRAHPKEILQKLYEAALGLRYLHEKQVVHKDLKCNNILIGNDGLAKLTDFGLSTLLANPVLNKEEPETELEDSEKPNVGAVRWKAPEVLEGENATLASDVYSFGMCILEAASGTFPWGKMLDAAIKHHVVKQKRIPQCPENCDEDLYELVKRMCRFDASERIGMTEVVDVLDELRSYEDDEIKLQINIEVSK
ncbi:Serine/threonine protein kinase [Phytophthora megakarya]|uniref:Serine/threonine protein kinase n=1 Tax=Phytophthora megakarya TaxID=4795 RepID=A0A225V169_9STRA|nr:Serine/threonine protein kinase [Phytophthora megakarya]